MGDGVGCLLFGARVVVVLGWDGWMDGPVVIFFGHTSFFSDDMCS
jgi:hypothetical protein